VIHHSGDSDEFRRGKCFGATVHKEKAAPILRNASRLWADLSQTLVGPTGHIQVLTGCTELHSEQAF